MFVSNFANENRFGTPVQLNFKFTPVCLRLNLLAWNIANFNVYVNWALCSRDTEVTNTKSEYTFVVLTCVKFTLMCIGKKGKRP